MPEFLLFARSIVPNFFCTLPFSQPSWNTATVFKLESIKAHNVSSAHVKWIQKEKVKAKPGSGAVEKAMDELGKVAFERMCKM